MQERSRFSGSPYLSSPARTLYEACHEAGRAKGGAACPSCPVKEICDADRSRRRIAKDALDMRD